MPALEATIAILILSYNGGKDTIAAIESLAGQRERVLDIFVSDNNSNLETKSILRENQQRLQYTFLDRPDNLGFAGGFNDLFEYALKHSAATYFLVLNNDTEAEPGFIAELLREARPERVVSPMILWWRDRDTVIQCAGTFDTQMMKMDNLFAGRSRHAVPPGVHEVGQTDGCCFLIHRQWLERGYRFDENLFIYFEDVELFTRLAKAGIKFYYVTSSVLLHKEYGSSGGRDKPSPFRNYYFYRNRIYLCRKLHGIPRRWRILWSLLRLAMQKHAQDKEVSTPAAKALLNGLWDGLVGRMGRRYQP